MSELEKKLQSEEFEAIKAMEDSRKISDELKNEFIGENGAFYQFYLKTKELPELVTCFRGNSSPEKIIIYYNNHILWELFRKNCKKETVCCVSISFNHSRYCESYDKELQSLRKLGFDKDKKRVLKPSRSEEKKGYDGIGYNGSFECIKEKYSKDFVDETYKIMHKIVDTYFNPNMSEDYFRKYWKLYGDGIVVSPNGKRKSSYVEKRWQSNLFHYFKNTENGLFVYDLEFSQPFPNQEFLTKLDKNESEPKYSQLKAETIKSKIKELINEPDMLAIRYAENEPVALVLVEVKSTRTACTGSSSIYKHMKGMYAYSNEPVFMEKRIKEARELMQLYKELGVCGENAKIQIADNIPIERLVILTDNDVPEHEFSEEERKVDVNQSAINYFDNKAVRTKILNEAKNNECKLGIIRNRYYEEYEMKIINN